MSRNKYLKTPEGQFLLELQNDFGFTPIVAQAVLKRSKEILGGLSPHADQLKLGQIQVLALSADEPAGKALSKCKLVKLIVTIDAGKEDLETIRRSGAIGLRRVILLRITHEAVEQDTYLTEEDAARILHCDVRTVRRDVRQFRDMDIYVPLRGHMINTGRGQTHKIAIIRWYLQGMTHTEIQKRTHHSLEAISRYVDMFGRIAILTRRDLTPAAIAQVVAISVPITEQYVKLYHELNRPEYQDQISRIVERVKLPKKLNKKSKKRRGK